MHWRSILLQNGVFQYFMRVENDLIFVVSPCEREFLIGMFKNARDGIKLGGNYLAVNRLGK